MVPIDIALGVLLLRRHNWARVVTLVLSGFWLVLGALMLIDGHPAVASALLATPVTVAGLLLRPISSER